MKFLINKVVIFTLINNIQVTALVEGIYKKNLVVKVPINVSYINDNRQNTDIDYAISSVDKAKENASVGTGMYWTNGSESSCIKKEFSYQMIPIENVLKYEISKEDLINIVTKEK